jgi:hypothetical protein
VAPSPFDLLDRSWVFLKSFWAEEGCRLDPNGHCLTDTTQAPVTDTGCMLDPDGRCRH